MDLLLYFRLVLSHLNGPESSEWSWIIWMVLSHLNGPESTVWFWVIWMVLSHLNGPESSEWSWVVWMVLSHLNGPGLTSHVIRKWSVRTVIINGPAVLLHNGGSWNAYLPERKLFLHRKVNSIQSFITNIIYSFIVEPLWNKIIIETLLPVFRIHRIHVFFWPPGSGSGSTSQRYGFGSGSGSFCHHAKIKRKTLNPTILLLFLTFYLWKII